MELTYLSYPTLTKMILKPEKEIETKGKNKIEILLLMNLSKNLWIL